MRIPNLLHLLPLVSCLPLGAQGEILYYKFDATGAVRELNFASGPQAAPVFATLNGPVSPAHAPGRFGGALKGNLGTATPIYSVSTGWTGGHQGDLTIALFVRNRGANTPATYSPLAGQPSWSLASGGTAGAGLQLRGWGGNDLTLDLGSPLCTLAGWNHFAIVIDAQAGTGTWYRNGSAAGTTPIAAGASIARQAEMVVGLRSGRGPHAGSGSAPPGDRGLGQRDDGRRRDLRRPLGGRSRPPGHAVLGNAGFAARVTGASSPPFALVAGNSYTSFAGRALPFDLSQMLPVTPGATLRVAIDAVTAGVLAGGEADVALAVPGQPSLLGFSLYAQAIVLEAGNVLKSSNALAVSVGR